MNDAVTTVETAAGMLGSLSLVNLLWTLATLLICLLVKRVLSGILTKALSRSKLDLRLQSVVLKMASAVMWFVIILIICDRLGINITSLVALFSVVGLAFSLAIQDSLSNLASGILLLTNHPFAVGDYVEAGGSEGVVKKVGMFYTNLLTLDNKLVTVPNSTITAAKMVNYSAEATRRVDVVISASYDEPADKVRAAIMDAVSQDSRILPDPAPMTFISEYGPSSVQYTTRVWVKTADYWAVYFDLTEALRPALKRNGVALTYGHINVHMINDK
jgi:small conductance mechanosensitive channel